MVVIVVVVVMVMVMVMVEERVGGILILFSFESQCVFFEFCFL